MYETIPPVQATAISTKIGEVVAHIDQHLTNLRLHEMQLDNTIEAGASEAALKSIKAKIAETKSAVDFGEQRIARIIQEEDANFAASIEEAQTKHVAAKQAHNEAKVRHEAALTEYNAACAALHITSHQDGMSFMSIGARMQARQKFHDSLPARAAALSTATDRETVSA